jgi:hypothetical protein
MMVAVVVDLLGGLVDYRGLGGAGFKPMPADTAS